MFNMNPVTQIGVSVGQNALQGTDADGADNLITNTAIVAGMYRKMSNMFRSTLEFTYNMSTADTFEDNTGYVVSAGWLLIF
jgi:hypothetical protein